MAGTGTKLFLSGEIAYASDVNTFLMDQVIARFATEVARDSAFGDGYPTTQTNPGTGLPGSGKPALTEGRFCYIDDTNDVQYYDGTEWQSASQFTVGDLSITTAKIADDAVTSAKIADNSITSAHIAAGTVIASDISNGSITTDKLDGTSGAEAVTTAKIRGGAVTSAKLDTNIAVSGTLGSTGNLSTGGSLTVAGTSFIAEIIETVHFDTSPTSTTNIDMLEAGIHYFQTSHSAAFILNFIGDGSNTFDDLTEVGQSVTGVILIKSGSTSAAPSEIHIDGVEITDVKWFGGVSFPDGSGGDAIDSYTITIIKTAATPTYTVLASQSRFS